jgi:Tfp pilus assembly protein PilV
MGEGMKRNGGYTFIEMLIAMTILIVGIIAIMRMLPIALREASLAGEKSVAAQFAGSQLGLTRATGAETIQLDNQNFPMSARMIFSTAINVYDINNMYTGWQTDMQRMNGAYETYLQRVMFSVEMPDGRRESFVTYVTRQ